MDEEAIGAPPVVPPESAWRRYHVSAVADRYLELFSELGVPSLLPPEGSPHAA